jgi:hypothetical protein
VAEPMVAVIDVFPEGVIRPRFKGVWYAATNFALILLSDPS